MAFKKGGKGKKVPAKKQKHGFVRASSSRGANPFDVRSNASKQKHEVIGRRVKGAGRNVAAARAEAERKRHKTLGAEFRARNKSNVFKDKRLGEQDPTLSMEDKMMARFQTERKRKLRNASTFALHDSDSEQEGDDDALFLTHKGAKISDDDYDRLNADGPLDDEDNDAEGRKMDRDIVNQLHFGGGKGDADAPEEQDADGKRKTHKEVMQEVMMKAKLFKAERQKNKSSQEDATDKLDEGFADLRGLLEFRPTRANGKEVIPREPMDDFDKLTREFAFEAKAKATERRMSPEEAAAKERDRLAELEKKRVARMHGADDDDSDSEDDGKRKGKKGKKKDKTPQIIMMPPTDDDLMDGYAVDAQFSGEAKDEEVEGVAEEEDEEEHQEESDDEEDSEADSEEDSDAEDEAKEQKEAEEEGEEQEEDEEEETDEKQKRLHDAEEAAAELPFVFECPESPEELAALFKKHARNSPEKRGLIVERIVTYYNPRLSVENKNKMKRFFAVMVRQFLIFAARYAGHKQDVSSASVCFSGLVA
jgi:nucleolar protein 14